MRGKQIYHICLLSGCMNIKSNRLSIRFRQCSIMSHLLFLIPFPRFLFVFLLGFGVPKAHLPFPIISGKNRSEKNHWYEGSSIYAIGRRQMSGSELCFPLDIIRTKLSRKDTSSRANRASLSAFIRHWLSFQRRHPRIKPRAGPHWGKNLGFTMEKTLISL